MWVTRGYLGIKCLFPFLSLIPFFFSFLPYLFNPYYVLRIAISIRADRWFCESLTFQFMVKRREIHTDRTKQYCIFANSNMNRGLWGDKLPGKRCQREVCWVLSMAWLWLTSLIDSQVHGAALRDPQNPTASQVNRFLYKNLKTKSFTPIYKEINSNLFSRNKASVYANDQNPEIGLVFRQMIKS